MDKKIIVCECMHVSAGDIENAVKGGVTSFEEVQSLTRAGTCCGKCADRAKGLVAQFSSEIGTM